MGRHRIRAVPPGEAESLPAETVQELLRRAESALEQYYESHPEKWAELEQGSRGQDGKSSCAAVRRT